MEHPFSSYQHGDTIHAAHVSSQEKFLNNNNTQKQRSAVMTTATATRPNRCATQRSLGFKTVVIYMLVFANLFLWTKLLSVYYYRNNNNNGNNSWDSVNCSEDATNSGNFVFGVMNYNNNMMKPKPPPEHEGEDTDSVEFWIKMALIVFLVMVGGIFAGLTIGLMGLDETNLHVLMASGSPRERIHAETVFKLLSRGKHWVLVTLLLGNVIVNETLPVVLDSELGGGVVAILISTLLIVIFGEIIPQAVCARYGLAIGAFCAKPMLMFMYIMSPVAYPIAMLLDSWLGVHHGTTYRRTELKTLVSLHQVDGIGELTDDEVTIIASVLDLKEKPVSMVMTPLEDVFTLSEDAVLDEELMEEIVSAGYSRIPIYRFDDPSNFIGMLLVKRLITYDPEDHITVRQFTINSLPEVPPNTSCLDILNFFQEGRSHMAMVTSEPGGFGLPIGVITLEDVIEELLGEEIVDESDVYVDIHNKIRVIRKPARNVSMIKNLKNLLRSPVMSEATTPLLAAQTPTLDRGSSLTVPVNDIIQRPPSYMATGKTIIQSRNSSTTGLLEPATINLDGTVEHDCAFKTGSIPKTDHLAQYQYHHHPPELPRHPQHVPSSDAVSPSGTGTQQEHSPQQVLIRIPEATASQEADSTSSRSGFVTPPNNIEPTTMTSSSLLSPPSIPSGSGASATILSAAPSVENTHMASPASSASKKKKKKKKSNK
ncbi:hypothetical protein BGZ59_004918 [Podila verticillata]|nr:hypothetical protein BGZ59_004918 [Podila verticillata]